LESSPQFVTVSKLRGKLRQLQTQLPAAPVATPPTSVDEVTGWLAAVTAADQAQRARTIQSDAINARLIWCDKAVEDVATADTDVHLSVLDDQLTALMSKVAKVVDQLGGATDPRTAIDAGTVDAWKQLGPLADTYAQIRAAQGFCMSGEPAAFDATNRAYRGDASVCDLTVSDYDTLRPVDEHITRFADGTTPDLRGWPADPIELLVWLAVNARVWVPTIEQLRALNRQRAARANQPDGQPDDLEQTSRSPMRIR
jgi:hypothetical protein